MASVPGSGMPSGAGIGSTTLTAIDVAGSSIGSTGSVPVSAPVPMSVPVLMSVSGIKSGGMYAKVGVGGSVPGSHDGSLVVGGTVGCSVGGLVGGSVGGSVIGKNAPSRLSKAVNSGVGEPVGCSLTVGEGLGGLTSAPVGAIGAGVRGSSDTKGTEVLVSGSGMGSVESSSGSVRGGSSSVTIGSSGAVVPTSSGIFRSRSSFSNSSIGSPISSGVSMILSDPGVPVGSQETKVVGKNVGVS